MRVAIIVIISLLSLVGFAYTLQDARAGDAKRSKVIDFEDETIEGLNKRPLDSLSQISEKDRHRRKPHLYRKRSSFRSETAETLRSLRYTQ
jgi:hypothetical protein